VLVGMSAAKLTPASLKRFDKPSRHIAKLDWPVFLNLLIYNSAGYDTAIYVMREMQRPHLDFRRAVVAVAVLVNVLYVLTLVFPYIATDAPASDWQVGYFAVAARQVASSSSSSGEWLQVWIIVSVALSNLQCFINALHNAAKALSSMTREGILPSRVALPLGASLQLARTDASGETCPDALHVAAALAVLCSLLPLSVNLAVESVLYALVMLAEVACFLMLRTEWPRLRRLFVVPALLLSAWVASVQNRYSLFGTLAALLLASTALPLADKDDAAVTQKVANIAENNTGDLYERELEL